ncbi:MAG: FHA domain-containing protein [Oscillospiraceae bacterium]|nr:FHA domain-containing protein [Oscillospiraceae bacterium]
MKQCPKGHIYDEMRTPVCPYCGNDNVGFQPLGGMPTQNDFPKTAPLMDAPGETPFPPTMPVNNQAAAPSSPGAMGVTVALDQTDSGINPVRGWLVVVDGEKKGTCFNIHGEQNSIGRGQKFDINISFDKSVSSDGNAVIAYDSQNSKFFISPVLGKGKNNIYHNDNMLLTPTEIKDYDRIKLGSTAFVFRSFCNDSFTY